MDIMAYLQNAFAGGQVSFAIFNQAFGQADEGDIAAFYTALDAESADEQAAFMQIVASVGYPLPANPNT